MTPNKTTRVLLVDDEKRFLQTTAVTLRKRGFEVTAVDSGTKAIDEVTDNRFEVVVLDVKMPGIDGHETLHRIKELRPDIQVIMLTAYGSMPSALEDLREGVFGYLTKPCDIDLLEARIREAVGMKRAKARTSVEETDVSS